MADQKDTEQQFQWSIKIGDINEVKSLLEKEPSLLDRCMEGRFAIHYAADYGQTDVLNFLLEKGADANVKDKYEMTPLLSAVFEGHASSVATLLKKGAVNGTWEGKPYHELAEKDEVKKLLK